MSDWTDRPGENRTGQDPRGAPPLSFRAPPPSTRTAPLPGMPSPAAPGGRVDMVKKPETPAAGDRPPFDMDAT